MYTALTGEKIPINCIVLDIIIAMYRNYNNSMYTLKCLVNLTCNGETLTMLFHYTYLGIGRLQYVSLLKIAS